MDRISESELEEADDTYDNTQDIKAPEVKRRVSINLFAQSGGPASTGHHGRSFITQGPNLLQVPQNHPSRRRHSWIPGNR